VLGLSVCQKLRGPKQPERVFFVLTRTVSNAAPKFFFWSCFVYFHFFVLFVITFVTGKFFFMNFLQCPTFFLPQPQITQTQLQLYHEYRSSNQKLLETHYFIARKPFIIWKNGFLKRMQDVTNTRIYWIPNSALLPYAVVLNSYVLWKSIKSFVFAKQTRDKLSHTRTRLTGNFFFLRPHHQQTQT